MAWLTPESERREWLLGIEKALGSGVLVVKYADKTLTYRSTEALMQQAHLLRASLGLTDQQQSGVPAQVRVVNDDGWDRW